MYRTILGEDGFKKGMKLYFERHDGTAVTCDDFRASMADANGADLSQFERWYSQAGTPVVKVEQSYDAKTKRLTLKLTQSCPDTPGQKSSEKLPFLIPVVVGLLDRSTGAEVAPSTVLLLKDVEQTFSFDNILSNPVCSPLRDFSAPVKLVIDQTDEDLAFLM
jgi:aminopeptidase N